MRWSPHLALVTFVSEDHIDWHGSLPAYLAAKQNLVRFQTPADLAVVSEECPASLAFGQHTSAEVLPYGIAGRNPFDVGLIGRHNQLNAQGAFIVAERLGCTWDDAQVALRAFTPLPHRLELVHESTGISWCNDSIATIPEAAVAAMDSFAPGTVVQIVGGSCKGLPFDVMAKALTQRAKAILTIGKTGPTIAAMVRRHGGAAKLHECGDLPTAVATARRLATPGDTVLLSPGCASYGEFPHFEARGEAFAKLARDVPL
ncbi:MAG: Mur ligase family protein [Tepidisphaeraceae bacterium]